MGKMVCVKEFAKEINNYKDYCNKYNLELINECTICHKHIYPNLLGEIFTNDNLFVIVECPSCNEVIVRKYDLVDTISRTYTGFKFEYNSTFPIKPKLIDISERIRNISDMFLSIYNQSLQAEANNLDQIAGMGYRKALEFLIKDYLKYKMPNDAEQIEKKLLGKCIDMITNVNIQKMAKGATWLGNDETHYIRKWGDKDIKDLKKLIDLTLSWMELEFKTEEYEAEMEL